MVEIILAKINATALIWAREVIGMPLEVASSKIGVKVERLQAFEAGTVLPTVNQLRKIGRVYKKPAAFFYQSNLPEKPRPLED